jgi:hypothetical protein
VRWRRLQVSRRVRDSLTQTQRCTADKRFLARFEKEREVGFAMLRVGAHRVGRKSREGVSAMLHCQ